MSVPNACCLIEARGYYFGPVGSEERFSNRRRMLHGRADLLKRNCIPKHRATIPIRSKDACPIRTKYGVGYPLGIDQLRNLLPRRCIPNACGVIKRASENSLAVRTKDATHDIAQGIEIRSAMPHRLT